MYDIDINKIDTVVVDFDETLVKSIDAFQKTYYYYYGNNGSKLELGNVRKWNFDDVFKDIKPHRVETVFGSKFFFDILQPYQDMLDAIKWLKSKGKKIVILSLGTPKNLQYKSEFIDKNFSGLYDYLILAGSEDTVKMDKSIFNYSKGCVLIDDNKNNLLTSQCEFKILSRLYTDEECEWNADWNGLEIKNGNELINIFR